MSKNGQNKGKNNQNLSVDTRCMLLMFYFNGCTYLKLYNDLVTILIGAQNIRLPIKWLRRAVFEKKFLHDPAHYRIKDWKSIFPCGFDVPTNLLDKTYSFMRSKIPKTDSFGQIFWTSVNLFIYFIHFLVMGKIKAKENGFKESS